MTRYRFTDSQPRVYVDRALLVEPGAVVDWPDGAPDDGQWEPVDDAPAETPEPDPAPEPAAPHTEE